MLKYITSVQHPLVKHLVKLRENRTYRYDHRTLLIEGITLVTELRHSRPFRTIVTMDEMLIPLGIEAQEIVVVNESVMRKISGVESPEGIVAEIEMPPPVSLLTKKHIIALDGVSDPGNLGTLLRSALGFGWDGVFLLEGCCDPFNDKALRAARGATFRIPLMRGNWDDLKDLIQQNKLTPIVADLYGENISTVLPPENVLLVLGNEAKGPSALAREICQPMTIYMQGEIDSLNVSVAGSIMMYLLHGRNCGKTI